ncbi:MAG TPA: DUF3617 domain-containing protein [Burkholderiaceae bacterium]|nr:DUF3617 domain-containing protein [Burkholderiaceae bacterium]
MKAMPALTVSALAVAFVTAAPLAHAQTQAPGLWEHRFTIKSDDGKMEAAMAQMQKQLAALPPEQRAQMEAMMASRGVKIGAQGTSAKYCLSKEQAAKPAEPHLNSADCTRQDVTRSGNTMKFRFECSRPQPVKGDGEMTFTSDKAYSGRSNVVTQMGGQPQQMAMEMSGQWLSADCGDIKPIAPPAK